jgi:acyl dehydratase
MRRAVRAETPITETQRQILGKEFARSEQHVTRDMLLDYANLLGTTHPPYIDAEEARAQGYRDLIAMPTFLIADAATPLVPPEIPFHGGGLNAGYECTYFGEVYPGDTLTYSTCIADLYDKTGRSGTMRFVIRETTVSNQDGKIVAIVRNPFILRW